MAASASRMAAARRIRRIPARTPDRGRAARKPPSTTAPARARQNPNAAGSRPCRYAACAIGPSSANARADPTIRAAPTVTDLVLSRPGSMAYKPTAR